jgi:hypothetical protein
VIASGAVFLGAGRCSCQAGSLGASVVDMMKCACWNSSGFVVL